MPLPIGTRVGPYIIDAPIGAGGMGEVYRARDSRLNRDVAIKVLPDLFSRDPDRLARFEREAQAVAALSHPGILAIHDFGTSGQTTYAVMELLEGETLRERLADGPLPPRKAVEYAVQIARALAAAHDRGIIHRDLKPENLFITADDRAKILDFGLARQATTVVAGDQTYSPDASRQTTPGTVLGTMGYMSPEQVRGEAGDQRSDIFAFGAVLYEMVTGRRAFAGNTPAETVSAVLRDEPADPLTVATGLQPPVARIIWHCLEKKPETRFRSAHDLAFALETVTGVSSSPMPASELSAKRGRLGSWRTAAAIAAIAAVPLVFWLGRRTAEPGGVSAPNIQPKFTRLTFDQGTVTRARFAPDGHTILYSARWAGQPSRLFLARVDQPGATRLSLPDSSLLAISASGELAIKTDQIDVRGIERLGTLALSPMLGGSPRAVMENVTGADWNAAGQLAVVRVDGARQRLESPPGTVLYESDGEIGWPRFSRSGDLIAFLDWPVKNDDRGSVNIVTLAGEHRKISDGWEAVRGLAWSPNGDEVWFTGAPPSGGYELHATNLHGTGGRLIYRAPGNLLLHDVQKDGKALLVDYVRTIRTGALLEGESSERDLSLFEGSPARDISPDGRSVVMSYFGVGSMNNYSVYTRSMDASDPTLIGEGQAQQFSPDGKWVLSVAHGPPVRVLLLPTGTGQARTVSTGNITISDARWLPDGRRIVAIGTETGRGRRAYVMTIDSGSRRAISPEGITFESNMLAVAPDGTAVILRAPDGRVMTYPVEEGGTPSPTPGLAAREMPIGWTGDSKSVLVVAAGHRNRIDRIDRATGRREAWMELRPPEQGLLDSRATIAFARNSRSYVANYQRVGMALFLVDGLR